MGDVLLSALLGSAQIQAVSTSASTEGTVRQLPPEIAVLPQGSLLKGFVINRTDQNHPILRTSLGDVMVKSELFLKTGSEVVLRIAQQGGQANTSIVSVDSVPLKTLIQQQQLMTAKTDSVQPSTLAMNTNNPQPVSAPIVQGVVLKMAQFGNEAQTQQTLASILRMPPAQIPQLEQGMTLQFRVTGGTVGTAAMTTTAGSASNHAAPLASAPFSASSSAAHYGAYSKLSAAAGHSNSQATPLPTAPTSTKAGTLSARVIGHEAGETILRTSIGTIKLFTPSALPTGSSLQLELVPQSAQQTINTSAATASVTVTTDEASPQLRVSLAGQFSDSWDSLEQTHHLLQQQSPQQSAEMASRIPNTKSELVNQALFFLSALRGNDLQRFFGQQTLQMLEEKSPKLLQRLGTDFSNLRLLATEQPDTNWQMLFFPLIHEEELHQARLYLRRDPHENQPNADEETRFVLEVELSELGEIQIDGLMHGSKAQKLFDVTLRSATPLEDTMKDDIRALYRNAADAVGFSGQVRFASGAHNMLTPLQDIRAESSPDAGSILA